MSNGLAKGWEHGYQSQALSGFSAARADGDGLAPTEIGQHFGKLNASMAYSS
jgi:hypothetical protein